MAQKILLKKSNVVDKTPSSSSLEFGELAINFASGSGKSFLATKKYDGTVAKFHEDAYNDGKFATKSDVGNIQSTLSNYALSATVKNEISALTATIEGDEYVIAQAFNNQNDRITALEEATEGLSGDYLTVSSANSIVASLSSDIQDALLKANSAYSYTNAVSATVKNTYWTSATTKGKIDEAKAVATDSAVTYANNTFLTKASAGTMYNSITSQFGSYATTDEMNTQIANASARTYAASSAYTNTQDASLSAKTFSSAKTYADTTFLTKSSAGTMYNSITSKFGEYMPTTDVNAQIASSSARSVSSSVTYTDSRDAAISASTFGSAKTYADATFLTKASAGTMYSNITSEFGNYTNTNSMNEQIANASARTYANASSYTNTQVANASARTFSSGKTYADETFLTKASAGTMYSNVTSMFGEYAKTSDMDSQIANASARTYAASSSYTNTRLAVTSASTFASAKTYADDTFVKKDTYNTYTGNVASTLSSLGEGISATSAAVKTLSGNVVTFVNDKLSKVYVYKGSVANYASLPNSGKVAGYVYNVVAANGDTPAGTNYAWNGSEWDALGGTIDMSWVASSASLLSVQSKVETITTGLSASVVTSYATKSVASGYAVTALSQAKSYTDTATEGLFTKASAGTMYSNITSEFGNYTQTTGMNQQIANASARTYAAASAYTNTQDASLSAKTFASAKTYADTTFLTKASAGTMYNDVTNSITNLNTSLTTLSGTVVNDYATDAMASSYAAAALSNAMDYTDSKIQGIGIGDYLTRASAGTMYNNITSEFGNYTKTTDMNTQIANASARSVSSSVTYTNTRDAALSASTFGSAKTYADATFLTRASAGTMYNNVTSEFSNYTNTSDMNVQIANASARSVTSSVTYTNTRDAAISASTFGSAKTYADATFLTKASAGTMYNSVTSEFGNYMPTTEVNSQIANASARSVSSSVTYTNTRDAAVSASTFASAKTYADATFLTKASAGTMYSNITSELSNYVKTSDMNTQIANASARTYAAASAYTNTQDASLSAKTFASAKTYADSTFLTRSSAGTMYNNITSRFDDYALSAVVNTRLSAISASSVSSSITYTNARDAAISASTFGSAKTYADATFLTKASAGTMYNNVTSEFGNYTKTTDMNTQIANASARSVSSAVTYVNGRDATLSASTFGSAKTYADATFLTKASAGTMYSTLSNDITNTNNSLTGFSATVINNYATDAMASSYAAAALSNSMDYTDSKIQGIGIGDYLTRASAGTMYNNITSRFDDYALSAVVNTRLATTSASSVSSSVTYTNTRDAAISASTFGSAKTYTDATFLTKASAGTMYNNVTSNISTLSSSTASLSAAVTTKLSTVYSYQGSVASCANLPATGKVNGYVYNVVAASGNTPAGTNYAWNGSDWDALGGTIDLTGYLTKASAGTMYNTLANQIENLNTSLGDYALSSTVETLINEVDENEEVTSAALNDLDTRIRQLSSVAGDYLTRASAGTMYSNITSMLSEYASYEDLANASASSVASSVTYTDSAIATASASTFASAKTYGDDTFLTRASAGTMYNSLTSSIGNYVAKTGDTMTGHLNFNTASTAYGSTGLRWGTNKAGIGADSNGGLGLYANGNIYLRPSNQFASSTSGLVIANTGLTFNANNVYHAGNLSPVTLNTEQTIASAKTFSQKITANAGITVQSATSFSNSYRAVPFSDTTHPLTNIRYINTNANSGLTYNPFTGKLRAYGFVINGKAATDLLNATGGTTPTSTFATAGHNHDGVYVPTGRTVNGHALNANVTVSKADVGLGNVDNIAQSAWTGNTKIASVGTITAGTWNGTKIANAYLANNAVAIDGKVVTLGTSATTINVSQSLSTTTNYRPILIGYTNNASAAALSATTTGVSYVAKNLYVKPSTAEIHAGGYVIDGKAATDLLNATGGVTTVASIRSGYVPTTRKVNGYALSADVTITKTDLSLGNVENTALSTWTGNTYIKSLNTVTAGTWNATPIATTYLAKSAITINGSSVGLGGSVTLSTTDKNVGQASSTAAERRALILGTTTAATGTALGTTAVTGETAFNKDIYAIPSTGELDAKQMRLSEKVTLQYNATTEALDFIFS